MILASLTVYPETRQDIFGGRRQLSGAQALDTEPLTFQGRGGRLLPPLAGWGHARWVPSGPLSSARPPGVSVPVPACPAPSASGAAPENPRTPSGSFPEPWGPVQDCRRSSGGRELVSVTEEPGDQQVQALDLNPVLAAAPGSFVGWSPQCLGTRLLGLRTAGTERAQTLRG